MASLEPSEALRPSADHRSPFRAAGRLSSLAPRGCAEPASPGRRRREVTARALAPHGYEVTVLSEPFGWLNPRFVADVRADAGATNPNILHGAYTATGAVTRESGITDLVQIKEHGLPVRMLVPAAEDVLGYYGPEPGGDRLLRGHDMDGQQDRNGRDLDLVIGNFYLSNTPAAFGWMDASVVSDLRFLDMPDELIKRHVADGEGERGFIPHGYMPGVNHDGRTIAHPYLVIYTRDDAPDRFRANPGAGVQAQARLLPADAREL